MKNKHIIAQARRVGLTQRQVVARNIFLRSIDGIVQRWRTRHADICFVWAREERRLFGDLETIPEFEKVAQIHEESVYEVAEGVAAHEAFDAFFRHQQERMAAAIGVPRHRLFGYSTRAALDEANRKMGWQVTTPEQGT